MPALIAGFGLMPAGRVAAQTFTNLYSFTNGSDGSGPYGALILSGNTLYGTTISGGTSGNGTVFSVSTAGTGFTNVYDFNPGNGTDGEDPNAALILSGTTLYGTTMLGGSLGGGTVFAVNTDGTGFTNLHNFTRTSGPHSTNSDGFYLCAGLVLSGNTLYGMADFGGKSGFGTAFAVNTNGTGFTNVHDFNFYDVNDGADPYGGLISSGNILYGTTLSGGASGQGTVFSVNTDGTGFTNVYSFTADSGSASTNSDGLSPLGGLVLSGNTLYGTAEGGGNSGKGTVFKVNTDGTGFTNLHNFTALSNGTNSDGGHPEDGLILSGNTLYGTASEGGTSGGGTVFAVNTDGTGFTNLHSFTTGSSPNATAGLILSGNTLYGTTVYGGGSGHGSVFSLSLSAPQLTITESGTNIILTWPTNATAFSLQSVTNLLSPVAWGAVSPAPTVVNGQYAVTNPVCGTQMFYRLSQ